MRIGLVSDAHGNPEGLGECLRFLHKQAVANIYFLGDAVGYLPGWQDVFALLADYDVTSLGGNHEFMSQDSHTSLEKGAVYRFDADLIELNRASLTEASKLPSSRLLELDSKKILLVHGSPAVTVNGYVYPDSTLEAFQTVDADAIFMGHTHRPFVRRDFGKLFVNVGSSGLPRDIGNLASCAIYDAASDECEIFRIPFDVECVLKKYGSRIHPSVKSCLLRQSEDYIGTLISPG